MNIDHPLQISPCLINIPRTEFKLETNQLTFVIDEYFKSARNGAKGEASQENFLQYWGKQLPGEEDVCQEAPLAGPVGQILDHLQQHPEDQDSFNCHDSQADDQGLHHSSAENLEEFFDEAPKNFEDIIDECSFDNCHFNENLEENSSRAKKQIPSSRKVSTNEVSLLQSPAKKLRKRDAKQNSKNGEESVYSYEVSAKVSTHIQKGSLKSKNISNSGLIIKIRSGGGVIMSEKVDIDTCQNQVEPSTKPEEAKGTAPGSSCSTSTVSNERHDVKSRRMSECSVSSIELENSAKIFCRSIGPLRAHERRQKVLHYLEKKRSRKWHKRINYT